MTLLAEEHLRAAIFEPDIDDRLVVMPLLDSSQIGPASIDVRLGTKFRLVRRSIEYGIDALRHPQRTVEAAQEEVSVGFGDPLWLHPGQFVLGSTLEYLRFPRNLAAYVIGRSTWGRAGLLVATAIMVQPGFSGSLTLELVNHGDGPIALYAGLPIAQLAVHRTSAAGAGYTGAYRVPSGPQVANMAKEAAAIKRLQAVADRLRSA